VTCLPPRAGIGVRAAHYAEVLNHPADLGWCEVHSENFFAEGGPALRVLDQIAERYPLSLHGVGLGLGSVEPPDPAHLRALQRLVARYRPASVSEHLCWSSCGGWHSNELLPMPYTEEAVELLAQRIAQLQDLLGRQVLIENVSCYLRYVDDTLSECDFVRAVCERAGCGLLLDVNNVYVNACNHGEDPQVFLAGLPSALVAQIHLAGFERGPWGLIDTHSTPVAEPVWLLYAAALRRFGQVPTLIEWDHQLPPFATLLAEAARAQQLIDALGVPTGRAAASPPALAAPSFPAPALLTGTASPVVKASARGSAAQAANSGARAATVKSAAAAAAAAVAAPAAPRAAGASLAAAQAAFAGFLRAAAPAVLAPELAVQIVNGSASALERLLIYRRSSRQNQHDALQAAYPVLRALVGEALFAALVADYLDDPGSCSGDLHTLGGQLAERVRAEPACASLPYLADVAELEWRLHRGFFAADHPAVPCQDPASIAPADFGRVRLVAHPSLSLLACATPASRIWQAHQPGHADEMAAIDPAGAGEWLAIYRRTEGSCVDCLAPGEFRLLELCLAEVRLSDALDQLSAAAPDLADWLPWSLQRGLLAGLTLER
jgi:uncharacterized protein (UPF0276 family)